MIPISPRHSDEFFSPILNLEWQWNHNPDDTKWSLRERDSLMRLHATSAPIFKEARNALVKRIIGLAISDRIIIDLSNLPDGDVTGLAICNLPYACIGVRQEGGQHTPIMINQGTVIEVAQHIRGTQIYLKVRTNFYYSVDSEKFYNKLRNALKMTITGATYIGSRFNLFCYHVGNETSNYADFDYLRLESQVGPANHFNASEPIIISYYDTEYNTTLQRS